MASSSRAKVGDNHDQEAAFHPDRQPVRSRAGPSPESRTRCGSRAAATLGGIYNNQKAQDTAKLEEYQDLGNGALSNVGARGRNSTTWFEGYGENFGRTDQYMFLRGGMYDIFKTGAYFNEMPHTFNSSALTPYFGSGGNVLVDDLPADQPEYLEFFLSGLRAQGRRRVLRMAEEQPMVFPGRRQPGEVRWHQGRLRRERHEPRQRFRRPGDSGPDQDEQLGRRGRLPDEQGNVRVALGLQQVRELERHRSSGPTRSSAATSSTATYLPPDNTFNKFTATGNYRDLPWRSVISARYTWAETKSDVDPRPDRAEHRGGVLTRRCPKRIRSTAKTSTSRSRWAGPQAR